MKNMSLGKCEGKRTNEKPKIKVFVRIWPCIDFSHENIKVGPDVRTINVRCLQDFLKGNDSGKRNVAPTFWRFTTDGVFYNAGQDEVYQTAMCDVTDNLLSGTDVILMCHGQSGSGKSFTALGLRNLYDHRGMAPRLVRELFERKMKTQEDADIRFKVSFIEMIGKEVRDLLDKDSGSSPPYRDVLKRAKIVPVGTEEEAVKLMFEGESRRRVAERAPYSGANIGKSILTIHVEYTSLLLSTAPTLKTHAHIVDMEGIDSVSKTSCSWRAPRDIGVANTSKCTIQQFFNKFRSSNDASVSRILTYMHKTLSTGYVLRMVGHIRPTSGNLDLTLSTLRFMESTSGVRCEKVTIAEKVKRDRQLEEKEGDVEWLRGRVELCAMLNSQTDWRQQKDLPGYRTTQLHALAESYITTQGNDVVVRSVAEGRVLMQDLREAYFNAKQLKADLQQRLVTLAEETEAAREKALAEHAKVKSSTSSKLSRTSGASNTSSGRSKGKRTPSKTSRESEVAETQAPGPPAEVGSLQRLGITLGPGIVSDYQGEATRARKREKKAQLEVSYQKITSPVEKKLSSHGSLLEKFQCPQDFSSDSEGEGKQQPQPMLTREQAWEEFLAQEGAPVGKAQAAIDEAKQNAEGAVKKHCQAFQELKETLNLLEQTLGDLLHEQYTRHLSGREDYDSEGRIVVGEEEKRLVEQSRQLEADIKLKKEMIANGVQEVNECVARLAEVKRNLEEKFEQFCASKYKNDATETELRNKQLEISPQQDPVLEKRIKYYDSLQHLYLNTNPCKLPA